MGVIDSLKQIYTANPSAQFHTVTQILTRMGFQTQTKRYPQQHLFPVMRMGAKRKMKGDQTFVLVGHVIEIADKEAALTQLWMRSHSSPEPYVCETVTVLPIPYRWGPSGPVEPLSLRVWIMKYYHVTHDSVSAFLSALEPLVALYRQHTPQGAQLTLRMDWTGFYVTVTPHDGEPLQALFRARPCTTGKGGVVTEAPTHPNLRWPESLVAPKE